MSDTLSLAAFLDSGVTIAERGAKGDYKVALKCIDWIPDAYVVFTLCDTDALPEGTPTDDRFTGKEVATVASSLKRNADALKLNVRVKQIRDENNDTVAVLVASNA